MCYKMFIGVIIMCLCVYVFYVCNTMCTYIEKPMKSVLFVCYAKTQKTFLQTNFIERNKKQKHTKTIALSLSLSLHTHTHARCL